MNIKKTYTRNVTGMTRKEESACGQRTPVNNTKSESYCTQDDYLLWGDNSKQEREWMEKHLRQNSNQQIGRTTLLAKHYLVVVQI